MYVQASVDRPIIRLDAAKINFYVPLCIISLFPRFSKARAGGAVPVFDGYTDEASSFTESKLSKTLSAEAFVEKRESVYQGPVCQTYIRRFLELNAKSMQAIPREPPEPAQPQMTVDSPIQ